MTTGDWTPPPGWTWSDAHGWAPPPCRLCNDTGDQRYWEGRWRDADAELVRMREALGQARNHVKASADAEQMMDGFGPRKARPSDALLAEIDAALTAGQGT